MSAAAFRVLLERMTGCICAGDGAGAAACFTPEGVYHDGFYGEFKGREAIARMVTDYFHRDARDFRWTLKDAPQGSLLILRYEEQFERAPVLAQLGFSDQRIAKSVRRWAKG